MEHKERMLAALDRREPDMVPIWELAFNEPSIVGIARHFVEEDKLPPVKMVMDYDDVEKFKLIGGLIAFTRALDLDGVTAIGLAPRQRLSDTLLRDAFGVVNHVSDFGEPMPIQGPIKDAADLRAYKMRAPAEGDFLLLNVLRAALPERAAVFHLQETFKISWSLRGAMQNLLMDYILNPQLAHDLARVTTDYTLAVVEIAIKKGADAIVMDGDLAFNPGPIMSPAHYDEFIGPYHKEIVALAHRHGRKIFKHSDGNLTPLIPNLIAAGFDGIHPIQPQCMDIGETKARFGDRLAILGNIDCSFLLVTGSEAEVREAVRETIRRAAPGGGYVISSSNSIHPGVKPENYIALARAAREFGRYPIAL
jgi:uroporphyrinogen decarboxylase